MSRELKFRAWTGEKMMIAFDLSQNPKYWFKKNHDFPLMQFTGLKDKSGKEIYEGDVVDFGDYSDGSGRCLYEVYWNERDGQFSEKEIRKGLGHGGDTGLSGAGEIIGNIYESPELLKP